ncbi:hypothetical protein BDQ12DRAFT_629926 [Crucibulum laeve]|uniref:Polyketide synthase-like phosphopantetheine-binding domain-containing protein n=1 Tax=Crucibulum laeve TaxID=68775 RepID=A0A5C3M254_9AGAR|nr:hypothetical protein BDQ12DRAFT_629926 [Crucibulum laeve]
MHLLITRTILQSAIPQSLNMAPTRLVPIPPQTQALSSKTFHPPPLNGSLTLPQLYEWHLQHTPNHRLFSFAYDDGTVRDIYWPEAVRAVHVGAKTVRDRLASRLVTGDAPVVAILAPSDTITYFTMTMAIMRANYIAFPISPRNSAAAVAHLISKVNVAHILLGHEQSMIDLSNEALEILKAQHPSVALPDITPTPLFHDIYGDDDSSDNMSDLPITRTGSDDIVIYLHSSGSTAFPKPIAWTNFRFAQLNLIPYFGDRDLTGVVFSLHTMPMFHGMGVLQLGWTASSGLIVSAFEPKSPVVVPTPDLLFKAAVAVNSDIIFCVPAFIEAWSRKPEYVKWLATRGGVLFGGGPLNKAAGDYMTSQGVSVFILYGSTEGGIMSPILPANVDYDWDYFRFPENVLPEMVPNGNNTFEFVMVSNPFCTPSVLNGKVNGADSYATSDLFTPHPTKPGYWRVYGRTDDQIMHNTGEKTNPGPLENMLNQDRHVLSSVMFGRGHFQAGVLIDPKPEFKFDPSDEVKLADFRNNIWPTVQKMNTFAPQHSRLFKEMIIVAKPSKPFHYTAKSTARRQAIINDYHDEIEALYASVEESTQSNIPPPREWDIISTTNFVRAIVDKVLVHKVQDEDDIFEHGCDSLQATWIRNSLLRAVRDSAQIDTRQTVDNFVYDHPSVTGLSHFLSSLVSGKKLVNGSEYNKEEAMHAMSEKYSNSFPIHKPSHSSAAGTHNEGGTVLVTGTTGALGSYLLAKLVEDPKVSRVYALNRVRRQGQMPLSDTQKVSLIDRGVDPVVVLNSPKVQLLEADFTQIGFGLPSKVYEQMLHSVTHVIHNAWPVDFNLALASFEPNVKGLRNLIDFALSSPLHQPSKFIYTSSIGVFQNLQSQGELQETPIDAKVAVGTGYTESKWVSEQILLESVNKSVLKPLIVRVGQLCGGSNGAWNTKEWLPAMVHSVKVVKCLPTDAKEVSWIPVDKAADALVDISHGDFDATRFVHLIHPKPVAWSCLATAIASELSVPLVSMSEWLKKLEDATSKNGITQSDKIEVELLRDIPALRLLPFFRHMANSSETNGDALGFSKLASTNAVKLSPFLQNSESWVLNEKDVKSWLGYWRHVGYI